MTIIDRPTITGPSTEPTTRMHTSDEPATDLRVRAATEADAEQLHEILNSPHILDGTMRILHTTVDDSWERLRPTENQRVLVAVDRSDRVVGLLVLVTHLGAPRHHHVAHIDLIATHPDHQGRGAASLLIRTVIEMAEQWMAIERLELVVFTPNTGAIRLYERLGFEIEGTMANYVFGGGRYVDAHIMARLTSRN